MAVYTPVTESDLSAFLQLFDVGTALTFKGIAEGVENSNFFLETDQNKFILTLYEKRVDANDLPFFIALMEHLATNGLPVACPVSDNRGNALSKLNGRPAALISFLNGVSRDKPSADNCGACGDILGKMHIAGSDFQESRANSMGPDQWQTLADSCRLKADSCVSGLADEIDRELDFLNSSWPSIEQLPRGIIHADLFPDNVLFTGNVISGVIDFYFACTDFLTLDLAICLNAWAVTDQGVPNLDNCEAMIHAYEQIRPLSANEKKDLPVLLRGAALRFLLTRLYDWLNQDPAALVNVKDPLEYLSKLRFHQNNNLLGNINA